MPPALRSIDGSGQLGMDEKVVEDKDLANLLEKRLRLADDKAEISKTFKAADKDVKREIDKLALEDGQAIRVGRFRIARQAVPPRSVSFDTEATSRLTIELWQ